VSGQNNFPKTGQQGFQKTGRKPSRAPSPAYKAPRHLRRLQTRETIPNFGFLHRSMQEKLAKKASEELPESHEAPTEDVPGERVMGKLEEGQIPMWMTAQEITSQFSPLENDRLYWYEDGRGTPAHDETDDEFWERKLRESKGAPRRLKFPALRDDAIPPAPSKEAPGFDYPDEEGETSSSHSLYDALKQEGVTQPVSLQNPGSDQEARPQVLGGNHRIAAMKEIDPKALIPVQFFDDMKEAQEQLGDSY